MVTIILFFYKIKKKKKTNMLQKNKSNRLPLTPFVAHLVSANLLWRKKKSPLRSRFLFGDSFGINCL